MRIDHVQCTLRCCALALCLLLAGCVEPGPEDALEEYLTRLARTLEVAKPTVTPPRVSPPPRAAQLRLPIAGSSIDGLDFLALRGCALQVTVGKRNSSLGRLAPPSQRLLLELEFLRLAPDCVTRLRQEQRDTLADELLAAWELKQVQLPALIFNATLASDEYRALWQAKRRPGGFPPVADAEVLTALQAIHRYSERWLAGDYRADDAAFELLLASVAGGDAGALWQELATQDAWLSAADDLIALRRSRGPLCAPNIRHDAADIVPNVVQRYFVDSVQPRAAALGRRQYQLLPAASALEALLANALPDNYRQWQADRDASLWEVVGAPRRHVQAIQQLLATCDSLPLAAPGRAG